jgi:hypothetical protein
MTVGHMVSVFCVVTPCNDVLHGPPKRPLSYHINISDTSRKTTTRIFIAVKTSNLGSGLKSTSGML